MAGLSNIRRVAVGRVHGIFIWTDSLESRPAERDGLTGAPPGTEDRINPGLQQGTRPTEIQIKIPWGRVVELAVLTMVVTLKGSLHTVSFFSCQIRQESTLQNDRY